MILIGVDVWRRPKLFVSYLAPDLERSPEVYYVRRKMAETGCDFFLDVHGDEKLPANFLSGGQGCSNYGGKLAQLFQGDSDTHSGALKFHRKRNFMLTQDAPGHERAEISVTKSFSYLTQFASESTPACNCH